MQRTDQLHKKEVKLLNLTIERLQNELASIRKIKANIRGGSSVRQFETL